jgi:glycogen(starch) synthase
MVGGAQVQAERAAAELRAFDVVVMSRSIRVASGLHRGADFQVLRRPVLPLPVLRPLVDVCLCLWQAAWLGRGADAVIGYQTMTSGLIAVLVGRLLGVPSLVSIRGSAEFSSDLGQPVVRALSRMTWAHADRVVVQSPRVAEEFLAAAARLGLVRSRLVGRLGVVPNAIDALSAPTAAGNGLVFVGRLHESKGLHVLIEALREIPAPERPPLVVVGDGPLMPDLQQHARDVALQLVGETSRERALEYMRHAAVFVFPAIADGMSNAVMEAMAIGLPVIATRVAGLADLIADCENGLLVPPGDATALRRAIQTLLVDAELRTRLGSNARRAIAGHSWARWRQQVEEQITLARAARGAV